MVTKELVSAPTMMWYPWHFCLSVLSDYFISSTCFRFFSFFELKCPLIKIWLSQTMKHVSSSQLRFLYSASVNVSFRYLSFSSIFTKLYLLINNIEILSPFCFTKNLLSSFRESMNAFVGYWKKNTSAECFFRASFTFLIFFV